MDHWGLGMTSLMSPTDLWSLGVTTRGWVARWKSTSARVAEVDLTPSHQRLGGEWRGSEKNLRQRPVALAALWRPDAKLLATSPPD